MDLLEVLAGLDDQAAGRFVENPELLAFGPLAHRVAQLRLRAPALGDRLLRMSRPHWHAATAYIAATLSEDPGTVASRLLAEPVVELLAEALQPLPVPPGYLTLLRHAPASALPIECHRLLAQQAGVAPVANAYREILSRNRAKIASGTTFSRVVSEVAEACALEPLVAAVAARLQYEHLEVAARLIELIRVLGLLGSEDEERQCLRRIKDSDGLAGWAIRRLRKADAPEAAFAWLKSPVTGFEPITSARRLVAVARMLGNCACGARYLIALAAGTECFALVTQPDATGIDTGHLARFRVGGPFVELLEYKGPRNAHPLRAARRALQEAFRDQGLHCLPADVETLGREAFMAVELAAEIDRGWQGDVQN